MSEKKPDGYLAVPKSELLSFCAKVYSSWFDAALSANVTADGGIFSPQDSLDVIACKLAESGWVVRPVKLQYLDEEPPQDE